MQVVDVDLVAHGLDRPQERVDGVDVLARSPGVEVVGHRRVHVLAALVHAVVQGTVEICAGPASDACVGIGRDVRREHIAERRVELESPGVRRAALCGVAGNTIPGAREVLAALRLRGLCAGQGRMGDRGDEQRDAEGPTRARLPDIRGGHG